MRGNRLYKSLDRLVGQAGILALAPFSRRNARPVASRGIRRVLVVKLAALGDTVLLVPTLRALRRRYPDAEVTMVGTAINEETARLYPEYVDHFVRFEVGRALRDPVYFLAFVRDLRARAPDVVLDFEQWPHVSPILLRLTGIPVRVGFRTPARVRHLLYTHVVPRRTDRHEAENFLALLGPLGIEPEPLELELPVDAALAERKRVELLQRGWNGTDPLVLIHPGCGHAHPRAWPVASYRELCTRLLGDGDVFFVFTGAGAEAALTSELEAHVDGRGAALGRMELKEWIAAISLARLVVSGNTGAMHLAAALRLPQVVLEGPNDPARWGALNPNAVVIRTTCPGCPCLDFGFEFHRTDGFCMEQIPVEEVHRAAAAVLAEVPAARR